MIAYSPIDINGIASWWRVVCFPVAAVCLLVTAAGCSQIDGLNECDDAPDAPDAPSTLNFELPGEGFATLDGPDGRLQLRARLLDQTSDPGRFVRLDQNPSASAQILAAAFSNSEFEAGEEFTAAVGYFVPPNSTRGIGGPANVRVIDADSARVLATFAACVSSREPITNIRGPGRLIRGAFHVTL